MENNDVKKELKGLERDRYLIDNHLYSRKETIQNRREEIEHERQVEKISKIYSCAPYMRPVYIIKDKIVDFISSFIPFETELEQMERLNQLSREKEDLMKKATLDTLRRNYRC